MVNGQWLMVRRIARLFAAALLLLLLVQQVGAEPAWWGKIDPFLLAEMQAEPAADGGASVEFLVQMAVQADVSAAAQIDDKTAKGAFVYQQLTAVAQQTQASLLAQLNELGVDDVRPFWISNMVWVRGDWNTITTLAQRSDVAYLFANPQVALDVLPPEPEAGLGTTAVTAIEWNIRHIRADVVWQLGYTGQGVVIGGQDTGYDWDHPALINQYRGWNGSSANPRLQLARRHPRGQQRLPRRLPRTVRRLWQQPRHPHDGHDGGQRSGANGRWLAQCGGQCQ
jgi:serine protease AprX